MKNVWSSMLMGILTQDISRELRFRDDRKDLLIYLLGLNSNMKVLEVGCGTGALSRKIANWLGPKSRIIGVDIDSDYLNYAKNKANLLGVKNVEYIEGDALSLPFEDNSIDACISHTVIEHVQNREFLLEQQRVCKQDGRVSVMISVSDKSITSNPDSAPKMQDREKELWKPFDQCFEIANEKYIKNYFSGYVGLPTLFDELGFKNVQVDAIALPVVADDSRNDIEKKVKIIEDMYKNPYLEAVEMGNRMLSNPLPDEYIDELKSLIEERCMERKKYIENGKKLWDYKISLVYVVSGSV
jgi:ubiquinone/menaquinone biosynthesis C-methylase UbiE